MRLLSYLSSLTLLAACASEPVPHMNGDGGQPSELVILGPGVPADAPARFDGAAVADPSRAVSVLYPLDGALVPRNLSAPDVQWDERGSEGDLYRVAIAARTFTLHAYVRHNGASFRYDYLVETTAWHRLSEAAYGSELSVRVDRWDAAASQVVLGDAIEVHIAPAGIAGAVYYWSLGTFASTQGRILRVRQGTDRPPEIENFMPQPPPSDSGDRCAACHGLARDGNRMAVALDDGTFGGVFDLTDDLSGDDPPMQFRFSQSWYFAAFNQDGSRLLMTDGAQSAFLLDGTTGAPITVTSGSLGTATHPAWSPDGTQIAMIGGANDSWNPTTGDLVALPVLANDAFGERAMLHHGGDLSGAPEGGSLDAYPSYSPDSRFIAFQHGTRTLASASDATGAIYVIAREGGTPVRLSNASEGNAWYPNFTPFTTRLSDGRSVFWLLLYSRRDYGNSLAGTRGSGRRQIWVAAVDADPLSISDPSFVPYWLPGQSTADENASAYWAPLPCRQEGEACENGAQCCSSTCESEFCGSAGSCRQRGESCGSTADCCGDLLACAGGACVDAPF